MGSVTSLCRHRLRLRLEQMRRDDPGSYRALVSLSRGFDEELVEVADEIERKAS